MLSKNGTGADAAEARRRTLGAGADQPRALHRLRLALEKLRYSLDIILPILPAKARELAATAASLQEVLGRAHDALLFARMAHGRLGRRRKHRSVAVLYSKIRRDCALAQLTATRALCEARVAWPFP